LLSICSTIAFDTGELLDRQLSTIAASFRAHIVWVGTGDLIHTRAALFAQRATLKNAPAGSHRRVFAGL
jgi:hypothetical protein